MRRSIENRDIEFHGTRGGALERIVKLPDGREYAHRCSKQVFEAIAGYIDDHHTEGFKIQSLADAIDAPMTQVNVALQLLNERSMLETHGRLGYVSPGYADGFFEHAMIEFYALIEGQPPVIREPSDGELPSGPSLGAEGRAEA